MPTLKKIMDDPEFYKLTVKDRIGIVKDLDPDFIKLSPNEQVSFVEPPAYKITQGNDVLPLEGLSPKGEAMFNPQLPRTEEGLKPVIVDPADILSAIASGGTTAGIKAGRAGLKIPAAMAKGAFKSAVTEIPASGLSAEMAAEGHPILGALASGVVASKLNPMEGRIGGILTPKQKELREVTRAGGYPVSLDALTPNPKTAKVFQAVQDWLPSGRIWAHYKRTQLKDMLNRDLTETLERIPIKVDTYDAGVLLAEKSALAKDDAFEYSKQAYSRFKDSFNVPGVIKVDTPEGQVPLIPTPNLHEASKKIYSNKKLSAKNETAAKKYKTFTHQWGQFDHMSPDDISQYSRQFWKVFGKKGLDANHAWELKAALKKDLDEFAARTGSNVSEVLEEANTSWQRFKAIETLNKTIQLTKKQDPEQVVRKIFRTGNLDQVELLKDALEPEAFDTARSRFLQNLLESAVERPKGEQLETFIPSSWAKTFKRYEKQIKNVFPEEYDSLKKFAQISEVAAPDIEKLSLKGHGIKIGTALTIGAGAVSKGILLPLGGSALIAKSLMNPNGTLRRWLIEGIENIKLPSPQHITYKKEDNARNK